MVPLLQVQNECDDLKDQFRPFSYRDRRVSTIRKASAT